MKNAFLFVSHALILCRTTKFCVARPNFVLYDQILRRTTKFCVVRPNFVSYAPIIVLCKQAFI
jgi:hypothetical protein